MGREEIEKMIAEALGEAEEEPKPRRPVPHQEHILKQYVELCEKDLAPDPSGDVVLPAAAAARAPQPAETKLSLVKRAVARVKR